MIGIVDCNNFFVSCERVFNPTLQRQPVLVLSNNDGCVIARSEETKKIGIPMGIPVFKVKRCYREACDYRALIKLPTLRKHEQPRDGDLATVLCLR